MNKFISLILLSFTILSCSDSNQSSNNNTDIGNGQYIPGTTIEQMTYPKNIVLDKYTDVKFKNGETGYIIHGSANVTNNDTELRTPSLMPVSVYLETLKANLKFAKVSIDTTNCREGEQHSVCAEIIAEVPEEDLRAYSDYLEANILDTFPFTTTIESNTTIEPNTTKQADLYIDIDTSPMYFGNKSKEKLMQVFQNGYTSSVNFFDLDDFHVNILDKNIMQCMETKGYTKEKIDSIKATLDKTPDINAISNMVSASTMCQIELAGKYGKYITLDLSIKPKTSANTTVETRP